MIDRDAVYNPFKYIKNYDVYSKRIYVRCIFNEIPGKVNSYFSVLLALQWYIFICDNLCNN